MRRKRKRCGGWPIPPIKSYETYRAWVRKDAETAANTLLCLIHQTCYLLDQQLRALERAFLNDGGITERLYAARKRRLQASGG